MLAVKKNNGVYQSSVQGKGVFRSHEKGTPDIASWAIWLI